jgi:TetR/AcrR family transcriptional repressor of nem operon
MRYTPDHKDATRERILSVATKRFRRDGIGGVSVASLMADVELTHGGFYAHFDSKSSLVVEAVETAYEQMAAFLREKSRSAAKGKRLATVVREYLSAAHREHPERGCPMAAIGAEFSRLDAKQRRAGAAGMRHLRALLAECIAEDGSDLDADVVLATLVGAMTIARVTGSSAASDALLASVAASLTS